MSAEIIQFIPRPNPDRDRKEGDMGSTVPMPPLHDPEAMRKLVAEQNAKIEAFTDTAPCEVVPYSGTGIDGIPYWSADKDPA